MPFCTLANSNFTNYWNVSVMIFSVRKKQFSADFCRLKADFRYIFIHAAVRFNY